jgi:tagatose-1,6-bisphosphate aldolase
MITTFGKLRHLSRASTPDGHFVILAIDHRTNLLDELNKHAPAPLMDAQFAGFKREVLRHLAAASSGVLIDPTYGISYAIADGTLHGRLGLLAPVEVTDYSLHPSKRTLDFIPNWSVGQIKRVGGDGVKLLLPYHPEADNAAEKHAIVQRMIDECGEHDIPFFLEPIAYSLDASHPLTNAELRQITVDMAKRFSSMGVDVLKLQFPLDAKHSTDLNEWQMACADVTAACGGVPWALLSGGVDYATFKRQTEIACKCGTSGVIVGRAIWADAISLHDEARSAFLATTARERIHELAAICAAHATSWTQRVTTAPPSSDWYVTTDEARS